MEDNLKVVWAEFSTLSQAVFAMSVIVQHRQAHPRQELIAWPWFHPVGLSLSML